MMRSLWFAWLHVLAGICVLSTGSSLTAAPPPKIPVFIAFKKSPGQAEVNLVKSQGGNIRHTYAIVPAIAADLPPTAVTALSKHKDVSVIEADTTVYAIDAELDNVWGVQRVGAPVAHAANPALTGLGVTVAVIDTGIDYNHPDLAANYRGGRDFVNGDNDPMDDNGHGTHVAGTIAAADNGFGVVGVAPQANLYALKVLAANGSGSFSNVVAALDWCVRNAVPIDLTNCSFGSSSHPGATVEQAFINAHAAGILNIAAAGNNGTAGGTEDNVGYPARFASVIAVAATTGGDTRASFSCTGADLELAGPGVGILSTLPNNSYGSYSGTSMACPHAVGSAAVLLHAARTYWNESDPSNDYIWDILTISALDLTDGGTRVGHDTWYGWGLVDIAAGMTAITAISPGAGSPPSPPPVLTLKVSSVAYQATGRRKADLSITVTVVDQNGVAASGATLATQITCSNSTTVYGGTVTTNSTGKAVFKISNAPKGTWTTAITQLTKTGYQWDGSKATTTYTRL